MDFSPLHFPLYQKICPAVSSPVPPRPAASLQVRALRANASAPLDSLGTLAATLKSGCIPVRPCQFPDVRAPTEHHLDPCPVPASSLPAETTRTNRAQQRYPGQAGSLLNPTCPGRPDSQACERSSISPLVIGLLGMTYRHVGTTPRDLLGCCLAMTHRIYPYRLQMRSTLRNLPTIAVGRGPGQDQLSGRCRSLGVWQDDFDARR